MLNSQECYCINVFLQNDMSSAMFGNS
uniref:Uncharacterized protein n=1 Tax=Anguilla anguilla TaxID=7936 RepID=A0A0E9Q3U3_ANGAN